MKDLFGDGLDQPDEEPVILSKFRFRCWNDDPQKFTKQMFDKVEIDVHAVDLEDALKQVRELINRDHHDVLKIHKPKK